MSKGIPKNGVNKGWYKKEHQISMEILKKRGLSISLAKRGKRLSEEHKLKLREAHLGQYPSSIQRYHMSLAQTGRKHTLITRQKISNSKRGNKTNLWKGGISPINKIIKRSIEYRLWREVVFARDNWTCQKCYQRGKILHPHHVKSFAKYPELRFAIDNGMTLCKVCHKKTDSYGKSWTVRKAE